MSGSHGDLSALTPSPCKMDSDVDEHQNEDGGASVFDILDRIDDVDVDVPSVPQQTGMKGSELIRSTIQLFPYILSQVLFVYL